MGSVLMIVVYVCSHESFQVSFVQYDHMIQQVSSATPNPTLGDSVLPGTTERSAHWLAAQGLGRADHVIPKFRIVVEEEELLRRCIGPSFPHLLHDPESARVRGDVEAQNLPPLVPNDKEAIRDAKRDRRHGEEVHGRNGLAMVSQECQPAPANIWTARNSLKPS